MFFLLSKLLDVLIDPVWWTVGLVGAGLVLVKRKIGPRLIGVGLGVLIVSSLPVVSNRLWWGLEAGAVKTVKPEVTYDAVILLGGVVNPIGSLPEEPAFNDNYERILAVRELLVTGRAKVAIVSGGQFGGPFHSEAAYDGAELIRLGVPADQVILEEAANNTRENATLSKPILEKLGAKSVLIVTSAHHIPRAVGCFRAVGLDVDALPVDYRLRNPGIDSHWAPRGEYLSQSSRALREWLGRLVYRVMGYTK